MPQGTVSSNLTASASGSPERTFGVTKSAKVCKGDSGNMCYVYGLKCKDGFYVGCTDDLKDRFARHQKGHVHATANRLPVILEFYLAINGKHKAFEFEKYLKSGSGHTFIKKHLT